MNQGRGNARVSRVYTKVRSIVCKADYRLWRAEEVIPCGMTFLRCTYCFGAYIGGIGGGGGS